MLLNQVYKFYLDLNSFFIESIKVNVRRRDFISELQDHVESHSTLHVKVIRWDNGPPETPARGSELHVPRLLLPFYERYNSSGITRDSRIAPTHGQNS